MKSALYIGAGVDMAPVRLFPQIKHFIYIDSRPQSPYGVLDYDSGRFSDDSFIGALLLSAEKEGFILDLSEAAYLKFTAAGGRTLCYFINIAFPEHLTEFHKAAIAECDTLILAGFCPDRVVLELAPHLETVLGTLHTVYVLDTARNGVFDYLIQNPTRIANYILFDEMTSECVKCEGGLAEFETRRCEAPYYKMKNGIDGLF